MDSTLTFKVKHEYRRDQNGIIVPVVLRAHDEIRLAATIDTGAQNCIFDRHYGD